MSGATSRAAKLQSPSLDERRKFEAVVRSFATTQHHTLGHRTKLPVSKIFKYLVKIVAAKKGV